MSQNNSHEHDQSKGEEEKQITNQQMQEILPRLFLGNLKAAENIEKLRSNNISFVLSIKHAELPCVTREAYRKAQISHVQIRKDDDSQEDLLSILEPVCDMIEGRLTKGKAVLVHCAVGKSRSATVVIAYVMRHLNLTCQESRDFVKTKRPMICPNPVFAEQLEVWEQCGFDLQKKSIVDQGPDPDPIGLSCTAEGKEGKKEGGEEAEQEAKQEETTTREELAKDEEQEATQEATTTGETSVEKNNNEVTETEEAIKRRKVQENVNEDEEENCKKRDENLEEVGGKGDKQTEASQSCENKPPIDLSKPPNNGLGFDIPSSMIAKGQNPQNFDDDSTTDDTKWEDIDKSATELPTPPPTPPAAPRRPSRAGFIGWAQSCVLKG